MDANKLKEENLHLKAELAKMQSILNSIPSCIYMKDCDGRYTYANTATCDFFGLPLNAIIGKTDENFFSQENVESIREHDRIASTSRNTVVENLVDLRGNSDETRYFVSTKAPLFDEGGQLIGISGIATDVTEQRRLESRLDESRLLLDTVLEHVEADIYMKDADGRYLYVNQRVLNATHLTREQMLGHTDAELFPPEMAKAFKRIDDLVFSSGQPKHAEEEMLEADGAKRYYWSTKLRVQIPGKPDFLIGFSTDITPIKQVEVDLARSEARFRALFESSSEAVVVMTRAHFLDCNSAALTLIGVATKDEFLRLTPADLSSPVQACGTPSAILYAKLIEETFEQGRHKVEWILQRYDNHSQFPAEIIASAIQFEDGPALLITLRDLTEHKRHEEAVTRLAFYDHLTQLPNRRLLYERLGHALLQHHRSGHHGCVIFLDLDNFKPLNDEHGHEAGDHLLQEVGQRLVASLRAQDTVARLGGDEFVVLLIELDVSREMAMMQASHVAEKIRQVLAEPYFLTIEQSDGCTKTVEHHCTASLGIALFSPVDTNVDDIIKRADNAMYRAKANGRNQACFDSEQIG